MLEQQAIVRRASRLQPVVHLEFCGFKFADVHDICLANM